MKDPIDSSIVVVAHPDDEALWFSSVLRKVEGLILCFLDIPAKPEISKGRRRCLAEFPIKNAACLGISESEASRDVNWKSVRTAEYGVMMDGRGGEARRYRENYYSLREMLRERLKSCRNVFTHNPWGEYGHAEHVQVYRAVKSLQKEIGFRIWCSNYCSDVSAEFMAKHVPSCVNDYVSFRTDEGIAGDLRDLYVRNGCWTWYDNWKWFHEECFIQDSWLHSEKNGNGAGHIFPVNMIRMPEPRGVNALKRIARRVGMGKAVSKGGH